MSAFQAAVRSLFADRNLALDAFWYQGGTGPPKSVRVIWRAPDTTINFQDSTFVVDGDVLMLEASDIPNLSPGDTVEIGSTMFVVVGEPLRDARRLIWNARVKPV